MLSSYNIAPKANLKTAKKYTKIELIGRGTFGEVYKAYDLANKKIVAQKKIIIHDSNEGIPGQALREITFLMQLDHPNIVKLNEVIAKENKQSLVFDYLQYDLRNYLDNIRHNQFLDKVQIKDILYQILLGVAAIHQNKLLHRDQKPQNILIDSHGNIKIADFGLARAFSLPNRPYTSDVATLWYRAPELLLGATEYSTPVDLWSVGTIFVEIVTKNPLFAGTSDTDQLYRIFRICGTPTEAMWPGVSSYKHYKKNYPNWKPCDSFKSIFGNLEVDDTGHDLLSQMLKYDPCKRITAKSALKHPYFKDYQQLKSLQCNE